MIQVKLGTAVVKTVMPLPFLDKKWPHGCKTKRKTASDFIPTERSPKGLKISYFQWEDEWRGSLIWANPFLGVISGFRALSILLAGMKLGVAFLAFPHFFLLSALTAVNTIV